MAKRNELERRAAYHRRKQKGLSPFVKLNAGDPVINAKMFNRMMGSGEPSQSIPNAEPTTMAESKLVEVYPNKGESKQDFIDRFMSVTKDEYPDRKQRYAVALSYWNSKDKKKKNEGFQPDDSISDYLGNIRR